MNKNNGKDEKDEKDEKGNGLELPNQIIQKINGPVSMYYLKPKKNIWDKYKKEGVELPLLLLWGDIHQYRTGMCENCSCNIDNESKNNCCVALHDDRFLKELDKLNNNTILNSNIIKQDINPMKGILSGLNDIKLKNNFNDISLMTTNTQKGIYSAYKGIVKKEDCDQMAHMNVQFYFGKHSDAIKNLFNKEPMLNKLILIIGPSGVGKGTMLKILKEKHQYWLV